MKSAAKPPIFRLISTKIRQGLYILASFGGELGIRTLGPVRDTAFRVLRSPFTLMEFRAFSFPVVEVILSGMASLSSDLSDKNNVHSNPILFFPTEPKKRHFGLMERTWEELLHQTPQSFLRLLRQESSEIINSIVHIFPKSNVQFCP